MEKQERNGQTFLEYTMLISVVVTVLISFTPMLKRAAQGMIKVVSDQVGSQVNAEQLGGREGYLVNQISDSQTMQVKRKREDLGTTEYSYDGTSVFTSMDATTNLGFQKRAR